jgi:hypothetical protein
VEGPGLSKVGACHRMLQFLRAIENDHPRLYSEFSSFLSPSILQTYSPRGNVFLVSHTQVLTSDAS